MFSDFLFVIVIAIYIVFNRLYLLMLKDL